MVKIELNQNHDVCMFGCGKEREMRRRPDNFSGEKTDSADDKRSVVIGLQKGKLPPRMILPDRNTAQTGLGNLRANPRRSRGKSNLTLHLLRNTYVPFFKSREWPLKDGQAGN